MYKTKLQELCHHKQWGLPKYSSMKDGPDHNPRFKASVSINGVSFHSPINSTSSKEANNSAAMLAFLHFTSPSPPSPGSPMASTEIIDEGSKIEVAHQNYENNSNAFEDKNGKAIETIAEGLKIEVAYQNSENNSNNAFEDKNAEPNEGPTIEEECKIADIQFKDLGQKDDLQYQYKSQLHNYARWKNIELPLYSSKIEGSPHARRFKATVKIDGHTFESLKFFNTMKEAEHAVAKVAFMSLLPDGFQEDDSGFYKNLLQELVQKEGFGLPSYKTVKCGLPHMLTFYSTVEVEGEVFHGKAAKSRKQAETDAAKVAYSAFKERKLSQSLKFNSPGYPADECPKSIPSLDPADLHDLAPGDLSGLSIADRDIGKTTRTGSYLLCNRVRVYTYIPDVPFPEGVTLLPISDDKWVAVSLEFPNEKGC